MKYEIYYALACNKGKVRSINQDNFWCSGKYLKSENNGLEAVECGKINSEDYPGFAVFDGMGGERYGEIAAYIAADTFNNLYNNINTRINIKEFLINAYKKANNNITTYAKQKSVKYVGTTAAMVMFGEKDIYICNIGDSRIYRFYNKNIFQISKDHVVDIYNDKKPALYQFLGIPENEYQIKPHIVRESYKEDDFYLICTDGLTDMLSEDEIKNIILQTNDVKLCVEILLEKSLSRGGTDNITIILCEIKKQKRFFGII